MDFLGRSHNLNIILGTGKAQGGNVGKIGARQWKMIFFDTECLRKYNMLTHVF